MPTSKRLFRAVSYALCLQCSKVRRPLGKQIHPTRVSEPLHFDFLYIGESRTGHEYILILKDDFSGYMFPEAVQEC